MDVLFGRSPGVERARGGLPAEFQPVPGRRPAPRPRPRAATAAACGEERRRASAQEPATPTGRGGARGPNRGVRARRGLPNRIDRLSRPPTAPVPAGGGVQPRKGGRSHRTIKCSHQDCNAKLLSETSERWGCGASTAGAAARAGPEGSPPGPRGSVELLRPPPSLSPLFWRARRGRWGGALTAALAAAE